MDDDGAATSLLRRGTHAREAVGDLRAAYVWFDRAYQAARRAGDHEQAAEAAIGLGGLWVYEQRGVGRLSRTLSLQREALAHVPPDSTLAVRLRTRLAAEGDYQEGNHWRVLERLADARRNGDPWAVAEALSLAHHCLLGPEHATQRHDLARELLLTAARTGRRTDRLMGLLWRTVDLFLDGDPHAERALAELVDAPGPEGHRVVTFVTTAMRVMLTLRAGDFTRAEELAAECARLGSECGDADGPVWHRAQMLAIRYFQGRAGELLPMVLRDAHSPALGPLDDSQFAALATIAAAGGDHRLAAGALARLGRGDLSRVPSGSAWLVTMFGAVETAAELGDTATAATAYRLLHPYERRPLIGGLGIVCFGSVEHALGQASLTMGDADRAVMHLRVAVGENLALGHWPAVCLSRYRLGRALAQRGRSGDDTAAAAETDTALREAAQLGMTLPGTARRAVVAVGPRRVGAAEPTVAAVRLLGPVDLAAPGGRVEVTGQRRRAVLATLALHDGDVVGAERVITAVWGDDPPATATNTLQRHVSHLRRLFGERTAIQARGAGYVLNVPGEVTDVAVAERLVTAGMSTTDPAERARHLEAAVRLWRGPALADLAGSPWLTAQADRLAQLRVRARHALAESRLELGRADQALADLEELAQGHRLHEQIHGTLMLALYRSGRQGDALNVYRRLRITLRDDLGLEPSRPLRELESAILRQDQKLTNPKAG